MNLNFNELSHNPRTSRNSISKKINHCSFVQADFTYQRFIATHRNIMEHFADLSGFEFPFFFFFWSKLDNLMLPRVCLCFIGMFAGLPGSGVLYTGRDCWLPGWPLGKAFNVSSPPTHTHTRATNKLLISPL